MTAGTVTAADLLLGERAAGRAADAAADAVALIAQGRIGEAVELLEEARGHITNAQERLVADDG
jgi:hypothetical protein